MGWEVYIGINSIKWRGPGWWRGVNRNSDILNNLCETWKMGRWEIRKGGGQRFPKLSKGKKLYAGNYKLDMKSQSKK